MASNKPSVPKGTRDFTPEQMVRRNYIFDSIKDVFKRYGYQPIETPAMENLNTLMGKYGEEGDKLLFKILNSGDFLSNVDEELLKEKNSIKATSKISEKGLRYDLTVPFARYVVQHQNEISFPFKRYQIQSVWRADKPQKGRYREFYQCDVDVIGSNSLMNEVELIQITDEVFKKLNLNILIKINNRKILSGIAEIIGEADKIVDITVAIDKLEKIGIDKVNVELSKKGISDEAIELLQPIINIEGTNSEKLGKLKEVLANSDVGLLGITEIEEVINTVDTLELSTEIELDLTLARGLNYYTGAIIEVKSKDVEIGSICGGGRYDDLTGIFGLKNISGVGVSFGADRIYDVLLQLDSFPKGAIAATKLMFVNFGSEEAKHCLKLLKEVRKSGISAELFPDSAKMKKQMTYANKKGIQYVALVGSNEIEEGTIKLKDMNEGSQETFTIDELIDKINAR